MLGFGVKFPRLSHSSSQFPSVWRRIGATVPVALARSGWPCHHPSGIEEPQHCPTLPSGRGSLLLPAGTDFSWRWIHPRADTPDSLGERTQRMNHHRTRSEGQVGDQPMCLRDRWSLTGASGCPQGQVEPKLQLCVDPMFPTRPGSRSVINN